MFLQLLVDYIIPVNTIVLLCVKDSELQVMRNRYNKINKIMLHFFRVGHKGLTVKMRYGTLLYCSTSFFPRGVLHLLRNIFVGSQFDKPKGGTFECCVAPTTLSVRNQNPLIICRRCQCS